MHQSVSTKSPKKPLENFQLQIHTMMMKTIKNHKLCIRFTALKRTSFLDGDDECGRSLAPIEQNPNHQKAIS